MRKVFLFMLANLCIITSALSQGKLLFDACQQADIGKNLLPLVNWVPYPNINDRDFWESFPEEIKQEYLMRAKEDQGTPWEPLTAMGYLEFVISGDRSRYAHQLAKRQNRLFTLVLAELFENEGNYLHDIVDGVWAFAEESTWMWPASSDLQEAGAGLPDISEPIPDLGAGVKAGGLAWVNHFLKPRLDSISPLISKRIEWEIRNRFITPIYERNDIWWMGYTSGRPPNNWNPWIISNYLAVVMLLEEDVSKQAQHIHKACEMLDHFLDGYTDNGGCEEGASYWRHAVGALFNNLDLLHIATGGKLSIFDEEKIYNMGSYLPSMQISGNNFVNFADAARSLNYAYYRALIYSYGEQTGNALLINMAQSASEPKVLIPKDFSYHTDFGINFLRELSYGAAQEETILPPYPSFSWFADIEAVSARDKASSTDGFFLAAKGGHNAESHNHNDVGNFIVYVDGEPLLIDVGVETYTRKTFSPERYTIWTMQSQYHNLPLINGAMQMNGIEYRSSNTHISNSDSLLTFSLDIAGAYPDDAFVDSWERSLVFKRGHQIEIRDHYQLSQIHRPTQWMFLSYPEPEVSENGEITFKGKGQKLYYPFEMLDASIEKIELEDEKLRREWQQDALFRIVLTRKEMVKSETVKFTIQ